MANMLKKNKHLLILLSATLLLCFVALWIIGLKNISGFLLITALALLATGVRGFPAVKGFSYSIWIFAAVAVSMFYPEYFLSVGNFQLKKLIVPLLQVIMFGMGSQMSLKDFTGVLKMPKGVVAGLICQYTIMPFLGFTIAALFRFPAEIAAGVILIGVSPSGLASNVMSYIAKANLALSITITAFATLLSPLLTPLLMKLLAGQFIQVNFWQMMLDIFNMIILPIIAGLIFNSVMFAEKKGLVLFYRLFGFFSILAIKNLINLLTMDKGMAVFAQNLGTDIFWFMILPSAGALTIRYFSSQKPAWLEKSLSLLSMFGIGIIITIITAAGRESLLEVGLLLILACLIHNTAGYGLGYFISRYILRMDERDCRTIAFEVGMQNGGLASGLALQMGKIDTVGLAPAVFGPLMNITGSSLATWWRNRTKDVN
jgi:BASS family bile acid:Na+ symporter